MAKVQCSKCDAWLKLPEQPPPRIRCSRCKEVIEVPPQEPAEELDEVEEQPKAVTTGSKPASRRSRDEEEDERPVKRSRSRRDEDEDEEDEDNRPRRKSSSRRARDEEDEEEDDRQTSRKRKKRDEEDDEDLDELLARGKELSVPLKELSKELRSAINKNTSKNETIIYIGQPIPRLLFLRSLPLLIFGLIFAGAACFFLAIALVGGGIGGQGAAPAAPFLIVPPIFILVGLGIASIPFVVLATAKRTCYVLTTRRALVLEHYLVFGMKVTSYERKQVANMAKYGSWVMSNAGDLVFREEIHVTHHYNRRGYSHTSTNVVRYGFLAIRDLNAVEELMLDTLGN